MHILFVLVIIGGYLSWALLRPLPLLEPLEANRQLQKPTGASKLAWPASGQAAVSILGSDILETNGVQTPVPIASTAKVITALLVLDKHPLKTGQQGPVITLTGADVELYKNYAAQDGSLVPVAAGEKISEYQMLQAIMLPSANNIADTMAIWAFGSLEAYADKANIWLDQHGLNDTFVGSDASGMSPTTTSTASDLAKLGKLAMQNPILAEIVGQSEATGIPLTTSVKNYNSLLGTANIVGIKTGNTAQAGGVFMSASRVNVNAKPVTIVTAVAQAPDRAAALKTSLALVQSAQANFSSVQIVRAGEVVGSYKVPWGDTIPAVASKDLSVKVWNGKPSQAIVNLKDVPADARAGQVAGTVNVNSSIAKHKSIPAKLEVASAKPSTWWRLTHPWNY